MHALVGVALCFVGVIASWQVCPPALSQRGDMTAPVKPVPGETPVPPDLPAAITWHTAPHPASDARPRRSGRVAARTAAGTPMVAFFEPVGNSFRLGVERDGATHWLPPHDPMTDKSNYGEYGPWSLVLVDLDGDDEPEVLSEWEQGGSGALKAFKLHAWDGSTYRLAAHLRGKSLRVKYEDLDGDWRLELVARFNAAPLNPCYIPWLDVYVYAAGQIASDNARHPRLYAALLAEYARLSPRIMEMATHRPGCVQELASREDQACQLSGAAMPTK
jgi:hypothetical protein